MEGDPLSEEDKPSEGSHREASPRTPGTSTEERKQDDLLVKRATIVIACMTLVVLLVAAIALLVVFTRSPENTEGGGDATPSRVPTGFCQWPGKSVEPGACYQDMDSFGYRLHSGKLDNAAQTSEVQLSFAAEAGVPPSVDIIQNITLRVIKLNDHIVRIKIFDTEHERYEVPVQDHFPLLQTAPSAKSPIYDVHQGATGKGYFSFSVKRKDKKNISILDTSIGNMLLADQLLQLVTLLPTKNVYGFGENPHAAYRHSFDASIWPLFSRDEAPGDGNKNLYGVHPFWMGLEDDGKAHGVLFLNSNAMEYSFLPEQALRLVTIGGILDLFVILGDGPNNVVELYTDLIGKPFLPPYWALGFQLSRYGYNSSVNLETVLERNKRAMIPQDVQHIDIDYMDERIDFTVNPVDFAGLQTTLTKYTRDGLRVVTILDPAIVANRSGYQTYKRGLDRDVYIKWSGDIPEEQRGHPFPEESAKDVMYGQNDTSPRKSWSPEMSYVLNDGVIEARVVYSPGGVPKQLGHKVWPPGPVAFPDFLKPSTATWWEGEVKAFLKDVTFHAIWIDMNEPAEFSTNAYIPTLCNTRRDADCWRLKCPANKYDDPPYRTLAASVHGADNRLSDKTLCMAAIQGTRGKYKHYDVHSLYGWSQAVATHGVISDVFAERSFVLSRSTYVSSGRYAGHWLGDNNSRWVDLHRSIIGMLEFNLFGIPYVGADICGFFGKATEELCTRWMQLGAFYPFSRNHNFLQDPDQDPGSFKPEIQKIMRDALKVRYTLLPYLYTLFYHASVKGTPVVRALWNEFPKDEQTSGIDRQFMWGRCLLISPILEEHQKAITFYLPKGHWYDFYTGELVASDGQNFTRDNLQLKTRTPVHVRQGSVLPMQKDGINTKQMLTYPFFLLICADENGTAAGDLYWDGGVVKEPVKSGKYLYYKFGVASRKLTISTEHGSAVSPAVKIQQLILMQTTQPHSVAIMGRPQAKVDIKSDGGHKFVVEFKTEITLGGDEGSKLEITWTT